MSAALAITDGPAPGYVRRPSKTGNLCDFWGGGKLPENPKAAHVETVPHKPFWGYAWIAKIRLKPAERTLLMALMVRANSETWRWPPRPDDALRGGPKGASMDELAVACGWSSVRNVQRVMRRLERMGLVIRRDCRPHRNEYQLVAERMKELAEEGKVIERELMDRIRERRLEQEKRADAALDGAPESDGGEAEATAPSSETGAPATEAAPEPDAAPEATEAKPSDALPQWTRTNRAAQRIGAPPDLVGRLVRAAHRAGREPGLWTQTGQYLCRPVLREWAGLDRPPAEEWARVLEGLALADQAGQLPRPRNGGKTGALRLLSLVKVPAHRELAWATLEAEEARQATAPDRPAPPDTGQLDVDWVELRTGHAPGDPEGWAAQAKLLREQMGTLYDTWVKPLQVEGVDADGRVRVTTPNRIFAEWVAGHYAPQLSMLAGGPVRLVW